MARCFRVERGDGMCNRRLISCPHMHPIGVACATSCCRCVSAGGVCEQRMRCFSWSLCYILVPRSVAHRVGGGWHVGVVRVASDTCAPSSAEYFRCERRCVAYRQHPCDIGHDGISRSTEMRREILYGDVASTSTRTVLSTTVELV